MLTPVDWTLAAQSATRTVVSFTAWMPLSVNCTKLMYVSMMLLLQENPGSISADRDRTEPMPANVERQPLLLTRIAATEKL
jgi:hypothetical protein